MLKRPKGKRPLLDTNVIIERQITREVLEKMCLSSVVLYELVAANIDESTLQTYASWKRIFDSSRLLITPTAVDWFECSKLVRNMLRGSRSKSAGRVTRITSARQQQNDALIARTATLNDCFVVTNDVRDFQRFVPYMSNLVVVPADYFFD